MLHRMIDANRALVRQGLKVMAQRQRPGLVALSDVARMDAAPNSYHLGFLLGPRVNAGGRIGKADLGARLLSTDSMTEAEALSQRLDELNSERRDIENAVRAAALEQAEERGSGCASGLGSGRRMASRRRRDRCFAPQGKRKQARHCHRF